MKTLVRLIQSYFRSQEFLFQGQRRSEVSSVQPLSNRPGSKTSSKLLWGGAAVQRGHYDGRSGGASEKGRDSCAV